MSSHPPVPRVLVLLAAFNGAKWIEEQLESIFHQEEVEVHVIVGDDGSSDDTRDVALKYGADRITLLDRGSPTGSAGQNFFSMIRAVDAGGFDYVAFSDQDDVWCLDKLRRAAGMLLTSGSVGYASDTTAWWPDGKTRTLKQSSRITQSDFLFEGAGQGCTYVLTQAFYGRARQFLLPRQALTSKCHYHDWPLYALARVWRLEWSFDSRSTMRYRQHRTNDTGARLSADGISRRITRLATGWYANQIKSVCELAEEADPSNPVLAKCRKLFFRQAGVMRSIRVAGFCIQGGRRKLGDNTMLIGCALLGWI